MKRSLSLIIVFTMLLSTLLATGAVSASAETSGELKVSYANVEFNEAVYLLIAVDYSGVYKSKSDAKANVTLSIDGRTLTADESVMETAGFPENSVGFKYTDLAAKNMGDELAIQAYDKGVASGDAVTYSILEYAIKNRESRGDDTALMNAIDSMLKYGAEAQKAFLSSGETLESAYDHVLAENGKLVNYGLVVISGANVKKEIRRAGDTYVPATDKLSPTLYDMSYNKVADNRITVRVGAQRYFYIAESQKTQFSLDVTESNLSEITWNYGTSNVNQNIYVGNNNTTTLTEPADKNTNEYARYIAVITKNGSGAACKLITDESGKNLALQLTRNGATIQFKTRLLNASSDSNKAILGDLFTFSITIGKSGTLPMCKSGYRFRGDGSKTIALFSAANSGSKSNILSAVTATPLAVLNGVEGQSEFATIHIVVDVAAGTLTYYVGNNSHPVVKVDSPNLTNYIYSTAAKNYGDILDFAFESDGTVLVQKTMYTKGNIFE